MSRKAIAILAAKLLLSTGLLLLVLAKVDVDSVLEILSKADVLLVLVWYSLRSRGDPADRVALGDPPPGLSYGTAVKYTWIGVFFGHVLPGSIAGDVAKGCRSR
jgi:uncharacterized membrane protein YbhN (UPF0104 family)